MSRPMLLTVVLLLAACASSPPPSSPSSPSSRQPSHAAHAPSPASSRPAPATAASRGVPTVLVSFDGFRADYLDRGLTPTFERLGRRGARARAMTPAYPSLTFPNHYTFVTGLDPDRHGIVHNTMRDAAIPGTFSLNDRGQHAEPRWWQAEPIWRAAQRQGVRTATLFWVGSEAPVGGRHPDEWLRYDVGFAYEDRVDRVLEWLARPAGSRPKFVALYLETLDKAGHAHGPDAPETNAALRRADALLSRLMRGLDRLGIAANVVVVSDHGMASVSPRRVIVLDELVPPDVAEIVSHGEVLGFAPRPGREADAERILLREHAHMDCWRKREMPARFRYGTHPRIPAIVCQVDIGWIGTTRARYEARLANFPGGAHGFDNASKEMRAIFLADGPAFRDGVVLDRIEARDVYNVLAGALGIEPAPNDGDRAIASKVLR